MLTGDAALDFALRGGRGDGPRGLALVVRGLPGAGFGGHHGAYLVLPPGFGSRKSPKGDAMHPQCQYQGRGKAGEPEDTTSHSRVGISCKHFKCAETRLSASWGSVGQQWMQGVLNTHF